MDDTTNFEKSSDNKKANLKEMMKKMHFWHYTSVVLVILLVVSIFTSGFSFTGESPEGAAEKAVDFMNKYLLKGNTATVESVEPIDGVVKVKFKVAGNEYDGYVSSTGSLFFPTVIDLTEKPEIPEVEAPVEYPKSDKPLFDLYYMSYCPYGQQAIQTAAPAVQLLGDEIEFTPHYVVYENWCGWGVKCTDKPEEISNYCLDDEAKLCSMHGIDEIREDVRQLCVFNEQKERFWDYTLCVMDECSMDEVEECWKTCADKSGVDKAKVESCVEKQGAELMTAERKLNLENDVRGSPTMFVNGVSYEGERTPDAMKSALCSAFEEEPSACSESLSSEGETVSGGCG